MAKQAVIYMIDGSVDFIKHKDAEDIKKELEEGFQRFLFVGGVYYYIENIIKIEFNF